MSCVRVLCSYLSHHGLRDRVQHNRFPSNIILITLRVQHQNRTSSLVAELLVHSEVDFALSPSSSISLFGSAWWVAKEAEKLAIRARQAAEN